MKCNSEMALMSFRDEIRSLVGFSIDENVAFGIFAKGLLQNLRSFKYLEAQMKNN